LPLDATLGLRRVRSEQANPQLVCGSPKLGPGGDTAQLFLEAGLAIDEEGAVLVGVEAQRQAVGQADFREQVEIGPGVLNLDEACPAEVGRIIDSPHDGKPWAAALEPVMRRGVKLQHHPKCSLALAAAAELLGPPAPLRRDAVPAQKTAQSLATDFNLLALPQQLLEMAVVDVRELATSEVDDVLAPRLREPPGRGSPLVAVHQALDPLGA
jgi:hypothetical protein